MNISLSFILIPWLLWEYNPHLMIALNATIVLPPGDIVWSLHLSIFCHTTHTEYQKSTRIAFLCSLHHKNIVLNQTLKKFNNLSPIIDAPQNHKSFYFFQNLARHNLEIKHFNYTRIFKSIIAKKPQLLEASHQLREIPNSDRSQTLSEFHSFSLNSASSNINWTTHRHKQFQFNLIYIWISEC